MPLWAIGILKFFSHPTVWVAMLSAGFVWFVSHTLAHDKAMNLQHQSDQQSISQLTKNVQVLQNDMSRIGVSVKRRQDLDQKQASVDEQIAKIPKTSTCHPFDDANLLSSAGILRNQLQNPSKPASGDVH